MTIDPRAPVIVGSGQVARRDARDAESCEPVSMMVEALRLAGGDSGTGERLLRRADSVRCVPVIGWRYPNAAAIVAGELHATPHETVQSAWIGGDGPQLLLNDTARAIASGELDIALISGAESVAALSAATLAGGEPRWRHQDDHEQPTRTVGEDREPVNAAEAAAGLALPVYMYALIENAIRAQLGASRDAHLARIANLWSGFSQVAAENPHAWINQAYTPEEIATPSAQSRLVAYPYTKLLTANIQVNMATGLILCSAQAARDAGISTDRWIFIHAGAQATDEWHVTERASLAASPAIRAIGEAVLRHAELDIDEIALIDLYSCFPSAVQIAAAELGLSIDDSARTLTVTGGLTFAGGPGNNYNAHAIASLVSRLREEPGTHGLTTAIGWYLTKHAIGIYSARPPQKPYASIDPQPSSPPPRRSLGGYAGPATIDAYTIAYARDGTADAAIVTALTPNGARAVIRTSDPEVIDTLTETEPVGHRIAIDASQRITTQTRIRGNVAR